MTFAEFCKSNKIEGDRKASFALYVKKEVPFDENRDIENEQIDEDDLDDMLDEFTDLEDNISIDEDDEEGDED